MNEAKAMKERRRWQRHVVCHYSCCDQQGAQRQACCMQCKDRGIPEGTDSFFVD